ncbi:DUF5313 family protein [Pseudofrankia sp. DC12]|uniref:DUF5313 family protein n=1 Tax=Pseudofrankia sp. DC12 TaxID=683315 RepID=UPI000695B3D3|nr:DUF5313 family protein [Pseudofrankia sp. DC12]
MDGGRDAATADGAATMTADATADASTTAADTSTTPQAGGEAVTRPPFAGRVSYVFSGRMPTQYSGWVFQDLTAPGWRWRQALRSVLMMLPFAVILAVLPGPPGTRGMLAGFLLVAAASMGLILAGSFRNRRLVQNGFPPIVRPEEDEDEPEATPALEAPVATPKGADAGTGADVTTPAGPPAGGGGYDPADPEGINA